MEQITLYYREGASDKVYQAGIVKMDGGYVVNFSYGRRGSTMSSGTKTQSPVTLETAKLIYDKLVREKMGKGYTPGEDGTPYEQTERASEASGVHCQLLNPVEELAVNDLLASSDYWLQEKFNGRRFLLRKVGDTVTGINRLGLTIAVPSTLAEAARSFPHDFIIDGEAVGDVLHAFDLIELKGKDLRPKPYKERYVRLMNLLISRQQRSIRSVETAFLPRQKDRLLAQLRGEGKEGVVFKQIDAPYTAGRPNSGGSQFKYKFCESASFVVSGINERRSVSLALFHDGRSCSAGNVTIPPNHPIPEVGAVVDCRYLYAFRESGAIYQPVYLGVRDDIPAAECTRAQLKYKAESQEVAA
jgi:bifunctional non-homologous end joining protein LigD